MEARDRNDQNPSIAEIRPPRLEDAGLEDCALPPDSIIEAFRLAAAAVGSRFEADSGTDPEFQPDPKPHPANGDNEILVDFINPETRIYELVTKSRTFLVDLCMLPQQKGFVSIENLINMRETSSTPSPTYTAEVVMELVSDPNRCPSSESPLNLLLHLTSRHHHITNFQPVLNYNGVKECFKKNSYDFQISRGELQSFDTIVAAVEDIVYKNLDLYNKLPMDGFLYIAGCIEKWRNSFLEARRTVFYYVEAHIDIQETYLVENILPSDALVRVKKIKEEDEDEDIDSRCAVCLEGFDDDDSGGDKEVYRTCCCHMFHCGCIGEWLMKKGDCPLCRFQLVPNDYDL